MLQDLFFAYCALRNCRVQTFSCSRPFVHSWQLVLSVKSKNSRPLDYSYWKHLEGHGEYFL